MTCQPTCLVISLLAMIGAWGIYRADEKFHSRCIDSMIEKIEELEG